MTTRKILLSLALAAGSLPVMATDVGVSIGINQPGVYGRIDIGRVPAPPVLVYEQPMVIAPGPVAVQRQPIYLHVPPGHARDWRRYCGRYQACGQPVYFVQDRWYRETYAPRYYGPPHGPHRPPRPEYRHHDEWRGHDRDRGPDRGPGRDHGGRHDRRD